MIKAVVFDIDGVLLDSYEANFAFYQNLMPAAGYKPPTREEFPPLFHLSMWDAIEAITGSTSEQEIRRIWEMGQSREIAYPLELLSLPDGTEETITVLAESYLLGIVTNRIRSNIFEAPQLARLEHYFRVSVAYEDTANHKPQPEPLLLAAERLGVPPPEVVYIGDVESDLQAARAAGTKFIFFPDNGIPGADATAREFIELPKLIRDLRG
jgi:phosphoglycolate phosphatase